MSDQNVTCSLCGRTVPPSRVVHLHGGRGREPKTNCISCMKRSAIAWSLTGCPFCVSVSQRILDVLHAYEQAGRIITLPAIPTEELPPHRSGCPWEWDYLHD